MDYTHKAYKTLLFSIEETHAIHTFQTSLNSTKNRFTILRHDVDRLPQNALKMAKLENDLGIQSSYYFRSVPFVFKPDIIKQIAALGHEIGYHYEDLSLTNGDVEKAYESFKKNLEAFRKLYPVKTICMHGSPRSKWDSREIWGKYDYKKLGIIGEPYFDVDYNEVFYLTDTGRRWDGWKMNVRDKVAHQKKWKEKGLVFHSTNEIIKAAENNQLPNKIMINTHPHRWFDNYWGWGKELILQNLKNLVKRLIVKYKK